MKDEKLNVKLKIAQIQVKLPDGAELGNDGSEPRGRQTQALSTSCFRYFIIFHLVLSNHCYVTPTLGVSPGSTCIMHTARLLTY